MTSGEENSSCLDALLVSILIHFAKEMVESLKANISALGCWCMSSEYFSDLEFGGASQICIFDLF